MYRIDATRPKKKRASLRRKVLLLCIAVFAALALAGGLWLRAAYTAGLKPVNSNSQTARTVTIAKGATLGQIANQLKQAGLIRSPWVFQVYAGRHGVRNALQAGTYTFTPRQNVPQIIAQLSHGKVKTDLVTIIPGERLDQIRAALINYGYSQDDVNAALDPANYTGHPALDGKPPSASLEGLIWPDSYQRDAGTTPQQIIARALDQTAKALTPDLTSAFAAQGLSTYQAIIVASMVEKEVSKPADRTQAAQVFLKRLSIGMRLGSDVTAYYGARLAGVDPSVTFDSPYNTRLHSGLPPTPISNVSLSALQAVAHPADTGWLYFVAGDDGTTHFANTEAEHESNVANYCTKLCSQ